MLGFLSFPFVAFLPLFLTGYLLLAAFGALVALGRRRLYAVVLALFISDFFWTFFSHVIFQPHDLFWFPTQYSANWGFGPSWDVETFYAFILADGFRFASRLLSSGSLVAGAVASLTLASVSLMVFTGALIAAYPGWFNAHAANFDVDFLGLNLSSITNGLLFYLSAGVAFLAEIIGRRPAVR